MKRICSILILIVLLLNSSVMVLISEAIDAISETISDEKNMQTVQEVALEKYINYQNDEGKGTLVQLKVDVGLQIEEEQEIYLEGMSVVIECPKILEELPSRVEVVGYKNSYKDGIITIQEQYTGKLKYDGKREYTVILFYDEECYTENNEERVLDVKVSTEIALEDGTAKGETNPIQSITVTENIGTMVSVTYETDAIYDGYIKNNIKNGKSYDTEYNEITKIMISNKDIAEEFKIIPSNVFALNEDEIGNNNHLLFTEIMFEKSKIEKMLGEKGQILIAELDEQEIQILDVINNEVETDKNGNYVYEFAQPTKNIMIIVSDIAEEGVIEYTASKVICSTLREDVNKIKNKIGILGTIDKEVVTTDEEIQEEVITKKTVTTYQESLEEVIEIKEAKEKILLEVSEDTLTNNVQNELTITAILQKDSPECKLFENPTIYIEFPEEVEKVMLTDTSDPLYDEELTKTEAVVETDESGKKSIKVSLTGKQTEYQTETLSKGTNIQMSVIVILKQDIESKTSSIKMICNDNIYEKTVNLIDKDQETEGPSIPEEPGDVVDVEGIKVETKAIRGDIVLNNNDTIYEQEIIKYEVKITNTKEDAVENVRILGKIAEGTTYVDLEEGTFYLENYEFVSNNSITHKKIEVGTINPGQTVKHYYEVKVNDLADEEQEKIANTEIEVYAGQTQISTYNLANTIKQAEISLETKVYIGRAKRNELVYPVYIRNISSEEQKEVNVVIQLSKNVQVEEIDILGTNNGIIEKTIENNCIKIKFSSIKPMGEDVIEEHTDLEGIGLEVKENEALLYIIANVVNLEENEDYSWELKAIATGTTQSGTVYKSNENRAIVYVEAVEITQSSEQEGETLNVDDEITYTYEIKNVGKVVTEWGEYTAVTFSDYIPNELEILSVKYNTNDVKSEVIDGEHKVIITPRPVEFGEIQLAEVNQNDNTNKPRLEMVIYIKTGEICTVEIKTKVRTIYDDTDIENYAMVTGGTINTKQSNIVQNSLKGYKIVTDGGDDVEEDKPIEPDNPDIDNPDDPDTPDTPDKPDDEQNKKFTISGLVWVDENENGQRDSSELKKSEIEVILLDVNKNEYVKDTQGNILTVTTDNNGQYRFEDVKQGKYYVIFKYESEEYELTTYKKTGISNSANSDAVKKETTILGEKVTVAVTDIIDLTANKSNIDLGIIKNKIFDLKLEKFVQKIIVQNDKETKSYNYNNEKFVKVEIPSKQIQNSTIIIEYKIVVTNVGELAGMVSEIIDEIPAKLDFHSEINQNWFTTSNVNASNTSLAKKEIRPGESVETTIILTKALNGDIETFTNVGKIGISNNAKHIVDKNAENDTDKVDIMVSISTGAVTYIGTVLGAILGILVMLLIAIIIAKKFNKGNGFKILLLIAVIIMIVPFTVIAEEIDADQIQDGVSIKMESYKDHLFTDGDGNTYQCQSPGLAQCKLYHSYVLDTSFSCTGASTGITISGATFDGGATDFTLVSYHEEGTEDITMDKLTTTDVTYKVKNNMKIYGPFKLDCSESTFNLAVQGIKDLTTGAVTDVSFKTTDADGNQITAELKKDFYIAVNEDVHVLTSVRAWQSVSGRVEATYKATVTLHYVCIGMDPTDEHCYGREIQKMAKSVELTKTIESGYSKTASVSWNMEDLPKTVEITKVDYDDNTIPLKDVEFIFKNQSLGYVQQNETDKSITYVQNEADATIFKTDANGKILVEGLNEGTYIFEEKINPNYGYDNIKNKNATRTQVISANTALITYKAKNRKMLGDLVIEKYNNEDATIKLSGVQFVLMDKTGSQYVKLVVDGKTGFQEGVVLVGTVTAKDRDFTTELSKATIFETDANGQIRINDLELLAASENIAENVSEEFILREIKNPNYGYEIDTSYVTWKVNGNVVANTSTANVEIPITIQNKVIKAGVTTDVLDVKVENEQKYVRISGFVWEDISGKNNARDDVYVTSQDKLVPKIKVILHDTSATSEKTYETWTDNNGTYSFGSKLANGTYSDDNILLRNIDKYYIEFVYNGMKYNNVKLNMNLVNGSKATEGVNRSLFNRDFTVIEGNGVPKNEQRQTTGISKDDLGVHKATIKYEQTNPEDYNSIITYTEGNADINDYYAVDKYHISATTLNNAYKLVTTYKPNDEEITNINLGIYQREQIDLEIINDVEKAEVKLNGYTHTYEYGAKDKYVKKSDYNVNMKFEDKSINNYYRTIYQSSVSSYNADEDNYKMEVYITYKISASNSASTLYGQINEIKNYYDSEYTITDIYYKENGKNISINNTQNRIDGTNYDEQGFKSVFIKFPGKIKPGVTGEENFQVYITYKLSDKAVLGLLHKQCTLDNMTEITSYSTYYLDNNNQYIIYASIDEDSAPNNAKLEIDADTKELIKTTYEDDTDSAPSLTLQSDKQNILSGTIWEDEAIQQILDEKNERLGNGIYDAGESVVYNVKVQLIETDDNGDMLYENGEPKVATLYQFSENGPTITNEVKKVKAETYSDEDGNYKFVGVIPDEYIIRYTYGENTYILRNGERYQEGKTEVAVRDYKSTIISSNEIKKALNVDEYTAVVNGKGNYNWHIIQEKDSSGNVIRYSDAIDNIEDRMELEKIPVNNSTINTMASGTSMTADTATFNVGIEFTHVSGNTSSSEEYELDTNGDPVINEDTGEPNLNPLYISENKNIDFGIILRPKVNITIDKKITHLSMQLANGQVLMDGDPRTDEMPYTKTGLDDLVYVEVDMEHIQGATLRMGYEITVENHSEIDYEYISDNMVGIAGKLYYYFGESDGTQKMSARVEVVGDYIDPELVYDVEQMSEWKNVASADELFAQGLISEEVKNALNKDGYSIFITDGYIDGLEAGGSKTLGFEVTKLISSKGDINLSNNVEILQLSGSAARTVYSTTPGNLIPEQEKEADEDNVLLVITTPTGGRDIIIYIITAICSLTIVMIAVIIIKKKVLR